MATISSPGIGSNLDVNGIVTKLMAVESQPLTALQRKEASYQAKLTAYGSLNSALASLQSSLATLSQASTFQNLAATSSDTSVLNASAGSGAASGNYAVNVTNLAQAQTISSTGQASSTTAIGSGASTTLTFQFGTISGGALAGGTYTGASFTQDANQATGTVTIDSSNNSLQGIRDAINSAKIGVTASIVNDGSGTPYHLVLSSNNTGVTKSMKISASGDASITSLMSYDPAGTQNFTQTAAAQNASLSVNGIAVTSGSNSVSGAIPGVTLNLAKAGSSTVTLAPNTSAVTTALITFVKAYNDANSTISTLTGYNAKTKTGGLLLGDSAAQSIQMRLRAMLGNALAGVSGNTIVNLTQVGLNFQKDGSLTLDNAKLQAAMSANFGDFAQLFAGFGKATDSLVSYVGSGTASQPGSYAVNVTALATQGKATGSDKATQASRTASAAANLTISAGVNDTLTLAVDGGNAISATLDPGTYTADDLAAAVQTKLNAALAADSQSATVSVTQSGGKLSITSNRFGAASSLGALGGNGATDLLGGAPTDSRVTVIKAGINDTLNLTINGATATVKLTAGTYTADTLAAHLQSTINGTSAFSSAGATVTVAQAGDVLTITSGRFGSDSKVAVSGGNAISALFGSAPNSTAGTDVAGTLNGVAARGSGQTLTGTTGQQGTTVGSVKGTQAQRAGTSAAGLTITAGVNDTITLAVDGGATVTATLTAGSYTADTLATEVQTRINAALTADGQTAQVAVSQNGGILSIVSNTFGAASSVGGVGGNGATNLFGTTQTNSTVTTITAGVNDQLDVSIDGKAASVTLVPGVYSAFGLAIQMQTAINGAEAIRGAGLSVTVSQNADVFTITSNTKGIGSKAQVTGGSARTNLFGVTQTETAGTANANPAGDLVVQVVGGNTGARGTINYSQGYGYSLNKLVNDLLASGGPIASSTDSANRSIADLQRQADALTVRLTALEKSYRRQFTSLDTLIGKMQQTSSYLTQQLSALSKTTSS